MSNTGNQGVAMFFFWADDADRFPDHVRNFLKQDSVSWSGIEELLIYIRDKRPDLTVGAFVTFLFIARRTASTQSDPKNILTIKDVAEQLKFKYATAARHCDLLSDGYRGKAGLGWVQKESAADLRSKSVFLSEGGLLALTEAIEMLKHHP